MIPSALRKRLCVFRKRLLSLISHSKITRARQRRRVLAAADCLSVGPHPSCYRCVGSFALVTFETDSKDIALHKVELSLVPLNTYPSK